MLRTVLQLAAAALVVLALTALPGCGGSNAPATKTPAKTGHYEGDGHDHGKDKGDGKDKGEHAGHDHEKEGEHK